MRWSYLKTEENMELSVNVGNIMGRFGFEKAVSLYHEAGFTAVDYDLGCMVEDNNVFNTDQALEAAERLRSYANSIGMKINQTHAPFCFHTAQWRNEDCIRDVIIPRTLRAIEVSAAMGASVVVVHPLHHYVYRNHEEEIFQRNMAFYRAMIPICRSYNIRVGIENMYQVDEKRKHIILDTCGTKEEFVRYIDTLDSEYMVACLDTGHAALPLQDDEVQDFVRYLGHDRLKALHVHDNDYCNDQHLYPYFGRLNWNEITKSLGEIDYTGDFTYETHRFVNYQMDDEFVPIALRYNADTGRHLIKKINAARPKEQ